MIKTAMIYKIIDIALDRIFESIRREVELIPYRERDSVIGIRLGDKIVQITLFDVPVTFTLDDNDEIAQSIIQAFGNPKAMMESGGIVAAIKNAINSKWHLQFDIEIVPLPD